MNDKGNTTLFALLILLLTSYIFLSSIKKKLSLSIKSQNKFQMHLCAKEYTGRTTNYITSIKQTNFTIKALTAGKRMSLLIPGYGAIISSAVEKVRKFVQMAQQAFYFSYVNNIWELNSSGCNISSASYITPTKGIVLLQRNSLGEAELRRKLWQIPIQSNEEVILINIDNIPGKLKKKSTLISKSLTN